MDPIATNAALVQPSYSHALGRPARAFHTRSA